MAVGTVPFPTPHDGTGSTFKWLKNKQDGTPGDVADTHDFTVTSFNYNLSTTSSSDDLDASHLGLAKGSSVITQSRPLQGQATGETGREMQLDYRGKEVIEDGEEGTLTITGPYGWTGKAKVMSSSSQWQTNELVTGSVTFRCERKAVT